MALSDRAGAFEVDPMDVVELLQTHPHMYKRIAAVEAGTNHPNRAPLTLNRMPEPPPIAGLTEEQYIARMRKAALDGKVPGMSDDEARAMYRRAVLERRLNPEGQFNTVNFRQKKGEAMDASLGPPPAQHPNLPRRPHGPRRATEAVAHVLRGQGRGAEADELLAEWDQAEKDYYTKHRVPHEEYVQRVKEYDASTAANVKEIQADNQAAAYLQHAELEQRAQDKRDAWDARRAERAARPGIKGFVGKVTPTAVAAEAIQQAAANSAQRLARYVPGGPQALAGVEAVATATDPLALWEKLGETSERNRQAVPHDEDYIRMATGQTASNVLAAHRANDPLFDEKLDQAYASVTAGMPSEYPTGAPSSEDRFRALLRSQINNRDYTRFGYHTEPHGAGGVRMTDSTPFNDWSPEAQNWYAEKVLNDLVLNGEGATLFNQPGPLIRRWDTPDSEDPIDHLIRTQR